MPLLVRVGPSGFSACSAPAEAEQFPLAAAAPALDAGSVCRPPHANVRRRGSVVRAARDNRMGGLDGRAARTFASPDDFSAALDPPQPTSSYDRMGAVL